jgi:hypothetical protein
MNLLTGRERAHQLDRDSGLGHIANDAGFNIV